VISKDHITTGLFRPLRDGDKAALALVLAPNKPTPGPAVALESTIHANKGGDSDGQ
jgi:hypothetical protein